MNDNLGRLVKWQDDQQGWHTGQEVTMPREFDYPRGEILPVGETFAVDEHIAIMRLVKESCDGKLTWVARDILQPWQPRSEWEDKQLPLTYDDIDKQGIIDRQLEAAVKGF